MMPNQKYDREKVLEVIAEYFSQEWREEDSHISFRELYNKIIEYTNTTHKKIKMPAFSQARKIIISALTDEDLFRDGERLSSKTAYQLKNCYYTEDIADVITGFLSRTYETEIYKENPITCIIKLPPVKVLDMLAVGYSSQKNKPRMWGRINVIYRLCQRIKKENPELILAVIPEFSRMIYLDKNGYIHNQTNQFNTLCDTLCMFVRNTDEGRKFVRKMEIS